MKNSITGCLAPFLIALFGLSQNVALAAPVDVQVPLLTVTTTNAQFVRFPAFQIQGTATDDVGLNRVELRGGTQAGGYTILQTQLVGGRSNTWSFEINLSPGLNSFLLQAFDVSGKSGCDLHGLNTHPSCARFFVVYSTNAARTPIESWQVANFTLAELLDQAISGETADPDGDGSINLVEYSDGTNPKIMSIRPASIPRVDSEHLTLTYFRAKAATDILNPVMVSTNLAHWNSGSSFSSLVGTQDLGTRLEIELRMSQSITSAPAGFMTVGVQKRPHLSFTQDAGPLLQANCKTCHSSGGEANTLFFDGDVYKNLVGAGALSQENMLRIMPGFPEFSQVYDRLVSTNVNYRMPYLQPPLDAEDVELIRRWILEGAPRLPDP